LIAYEELPGGWLMVIMDLLDESWVPLVNKEHWDGVKERLHAAISALHQMKMVHGDIRATNVMVKKSGLEFMLVDFDWGGLEGLVRYPRHVNKAVGRPDDAEDGELIRTEHDDFMLATMFR
jgi:serine/threonine protein kinase